MFAEFLLSLLVFPFGHTCVGLTVFVGWFSCFLWGVQFPLYLGPLNFGVSSYRVTLVQGEGLALLLLILAGSPSYGNEVARWGERNKIRLSGL